ncbi:hypothetical protein QAD02_014924 [Eretmocerus hayati]|uniref:Uncharacterized protein n=1 Tax=Eretmocerus hayati TaxID=131215 RepID=A0ACC2P9K9_9HYME|nr:hypothetical protein QAD02_014924 [Eretmocerus hayati]
MPQAQWPEFKTIPLKAAMPVDVKMSTIPVVNTVNIPFLDSSVLYLVSHLLEEMSSFSKLINTTAFVFRFLSVLNPNLFKLSGNSQLIQNQPWAQVPVGDKHLLYEEKERAKLAWVGHVQSALYTPEQRLIAGGGFLPKNHEIAMVIFGMAAQFWGLYRDLRDGWQKSSRLNSLPSIVLNCCDILAAIAPFTAAILLSPYRWPHLKKAIENSIEVDKALIDFQTPKDLKKLSIILILASMIPTLIFLCTDFVMWVFWIEPKDWGSVGLKGHINFLPLYPMKLVALVMVLQMAIIIMNINERFDKINTVLRNLIQLNTFNKYFRKDFAWGTSRNEKATISTVFPQGSSILPDKQGARDAKTRDKVAGIYTDPGKLIYELTTLHSTMCDCVSSINKAYGTATLVMSWSLLLYLTTTSYWLLVYITKWYTVLNKLCWLILYAYGLVLMVQPCHSLILKVKTTGELVSRALLQDWDSDVEVQLEIFSNLLLQKRIEITACGLFTIDRGLIASIVGTVTTYLVILVQTDGQK